MFTIITPWFTTSESSFTLARDALTTFVSGLVEGMVGRGEFAPGDETAGCWADFQNLIPTMTVGGKLIDPEGKLWAIIEDITA